MTETSIYFVEPPLYDHMYSANSIFHSLPFAVTYRRDRSIREVYDERFLTERPVSVYNVISQFIFLSSYHKSMHIQMQAATSFGEGGLKHAKSPE